MLTRKASFLDMARLIDVLPESEVVKWMDMSRDSVLHQTLVTIKNKRVIAGTLSVALPESNTAMVLSVFNVTDTPEILDYVFNKIPVYYREDAIQIDKIVTSAHYDKLPFFQTIGFVPESCVISKMFSTEKGTGEV